MIISIYINLFLKGQKLQILSEIMLSEKYVYILNLKKYITYYVDACMYINFTLAIT